MSPPRHALSVGDMVRKLLWLSLSVICLSLAVPGAVPAADSAAASDMLWVSHAWSTPFSYDIEENRSVWRPAVVADSSGTPYCVFVDYWNNESFDGCLSYVTRSWDGGWSVGGIEGTTGVVSHSLAIDDDDRLHMGAATDDAVYYFTRTGGSWSRQSVDSVESDYCRVVVDARGTVHLLYSDSSASSLKHATLTDSGWVVETIEEVSAADAVTMDADNGIHGCYYDNEHSLIYFSNASGDWLLQTIDSYCRAEWSTSIEVRADGTPVVVYCDDLNDNMKAAFRISGEWIVMTSDTDVSHASMAIDKFNNTVISYVTSEAVYFMRTQGGMREWCPIQSGSQLRSPTAIATDSQGFVHMFYKYRRSSVSLDGTYERSCLVYATNSLEVPYGPGRVLIDEARGGLELTWDADGGEGHSYDVSGYRIYRGSYPGEEELIASVGSDVTSYIDESVESNATYYYRVTSYNEFGESLLENAASADTVGWDWSVVDTALTVKDYALVVAVAVALVLALLLFIRRGGQKSTAKDAAEDTRPRG